MLDSCFPAGGVLHLHIVVILGEAATHTISSPPPPAKSNITASTKTMGYELLTAIKVSRAPKFWRKKHTLQNN